MIDCLFFVTFRFGPKLYVFLFLFFFPTWACHFTPLLHWPEEVIDSLVSLAHFLTPADAFHLPARRFTVVL